MQQRTGDNFGLCVITKLLYSSERNSLFRGGSTEAARPEGFVWAGLFCWGCCWIPPRLQSRPFPHGPGQRHLASWWAQTSLLNIFSIFKLQQIKNILALIGHSTYLCNYFFIFAWAIKNKSKAALSVWCCWWRSDVQRYWYSLFRKWLIITSCILHISGIDIKR